MRRLVAVAVSFGIATSINMANADTVKLATGNEYKPFTDETLPAGGLVTDIVRTAYESGGHKVEIDFIPWKRGERAVQRGRVVATFPYVKTEERLKKYTYSDPVFVSRVIPIVKKENKNSIETFKDMEGKKSCYPVGWNTGVDRIDEMYKDGRVEVNRARDMKSCYKMLERGRIDFVAAEKATAVLDIKNTFGSLKGFHFEKFVAGTTDLHLIFDKGGETTPAEVKKFNELLSEIESDGTYENIVMKHLE